MSADPLVLLRVGISFAGGETIGNLFGKTY